MTTKQISRNIALTEHLDQFVQKKVDSGRYQSASEVVREALRLLESREEDRAASIARLRDEIDVGLKQIERGEVVDGPSVFAEIREMSRLRRKEMNSKSKK